MEKPWIQYSSSCKVKLHEAERAKKFHFELQDYEEGGLGGLFFREDNQL